MQLDVIGCNSPLTYQVFKFSPHEGSVDDSRLFLSFVRLCSGPKKSFQPIPELEIFMKLSK